jgi:DHA2 family multidrug resistance protein-like MFS transporter
MRLDRRSDGIADVSSPDLRAKGGGEGPDRAGIVLVALILVAAVANLNLSVANVALPSIGEAFDSSQVTLNLIAVGYSLGLAASVLYLGAVGDRYGRKMMLVLGTALAIPMSLLAAYAPSDEVLFAARVGGGLAAGMAYPTTLALITALWSGPARTKSIALWSALGGAIAALGPLIAGALLTQFDWGSVFLITLPLAVVALVMAFLFVPSHVNETSDPVDNLGGILSVVLVGALILAINFAPVPNEGALVLGLTLVAVAALGAFFIRQRRAANPLYDLNIAGRRIFWVAACAGIIVFGSLMAAMFVSQQYLQNVNGYSTLEAGAATSLPRWSWSSLHLGRRSSSRHAVPGSPCCAATCSCSSRSSGCCSSGTKVRRTGRSRSRTSSSVPVSGSPGHPPRTP